MASPTASEKNGAPSLVRRVSVEPNAANRIAADVHPHSEEMWQEADEDEAASLVENDDPCRYLGCNTHRCQWVSGETVKRVVTKKSCGNAKAIMNGTKMETLTQCVRALSGNLGKDASCDKNFEMNMETNECMCVPAGEQCAE